MALEKVPRSDHELAHAVHGPTYRANHARIFGERRFPKIAENAPDAPDALTPSHFEVRAGTKVRVFDDPETPVQK